jgi:hypothetical protein
MYHQKKKITPAVFLSKYTTKRRSLTPSLSASSWSLPGQWLTTNLEHFLYGTGALPGEH